MRSSRCRSAMIIWRTTSMRSGAKEHMFRTAKTNALGAKLACDGLGIHPDCRHWRARFEFAAHAVGPFSLNVPKYAGQS